MSVDQIGHTVAYGKAAQELVLRRSEFDLAVHLGQVRTVPAPSGGRPRVPQEEIDRLRAEPDFPAGLRDRVRTVGTAQAAELAGISPDRFTRLARTGHFSPVAYYLNRYRAVVWLYLAREVVETAARHRELLTGRAPAGLRERLKAGEDARPRTWRARRRRLLMDQAWDAWARAAALASFLDPHELAAVVPDMDERARLERLRPPPPHGHPESPAARAVADRLLIADDPDEAAGLRAELAEALRAARRRSPVLGPGTLMASGSTEPWATVPGSAAPGSTVPGSATPGSTVPGVPAPPPPWSPAVPVAPASSLTPPHVAACATSSAATDPAEPVGPPIGAPVAAQGFWTPWAQPAGMAVRAGADTGAAVSAATRTPVPPSYAGGGAEARPVPRRTRQRPAPTSLTAPHAPVGPPGPTAPPGPQAHRGPTAPARPAPGPVRPHGSERRRRKTARAGFLARLGLRRPRVG
ncbi:DUF6397 family protein [Streptomyces sp. NPDC050585]|uniref:DUF6397 family protein n=1 Tax=Streptomyces sp. NPDC050585 TaxID=3365632 RepID=UPI00379D8AF0